MRRPLIVLERRSRLGTLFALVPALWLACGAPSRFLCDAETGADCDRGSTDAGSASTDAGSAATDAGSAATDAGSAATDAGFASTDAAFASTDAGSTVLSPAGLTCTPTSLSFALGQWSSGCTPSSSGGPVQAYAIQPALPAGLSLNPDTGNISGTPTVPAVRQSYTLSGSNEAGSANVSLSILVQPPAPAFSQHPTSRYSHVGAVVRIQTGASGTGPLTWSWSLDGVTVPQATSPWLEYTMTASDHGALVRAAVADLYEGSTTSDGARLYLTASPFVSTQPAVSARHLHVAVLLGDGRVLVVGGSCGQSTTSIPAEVYDPTTGAFTQVGPVLPCAPGIQAVRLTGTKVLIVGGDAASRLFDATTNSFSVLAWSTPSFATATRLSDGRVLLAGGCSNCQLFPQQLGTPLDTAGIYDADSDTYAPLTEKMTSPRSAHTATLLSSGKVLLAGGVSRSAGWEDTGEVFDPATGEFSAAGGAMSVPRYLHTATLLPGGRVLLVGNASPDNASDVYDPATNTFTASGSLHSQLPTPAIANLADGRVLLSSDQTAEVYQPSSGTWALLSGGPNVARTLHTATPLADGSVLVVGGRRLSGDGASLAEAELFLP